jgi:hypothetical protein
LMLFGGFYLLCCIHVWCIHWFIPHRLHLMFILYWCRFWRMFMCNLIQLFKETSSDYYWYFLKSTSFREALALFLNLKSNWPLIVVENLQFFFSRLNTWFSSKKLH